jgi:serine/threonine protein kinase
LLLKPLKVSDAVSGLGYLHDNDFVHGDLKGVCMLSYREIQLAEFELQGNILITNDHRACLADFGLMKLVSDAHPTHSTTTGDVGGTVRWMAPELLLPEEYGLHRSEPSKASDIYALGMVIFEVSMLFCPSLTDRDFLGHDWHCSICRINQSGCHTKGDERNEATTT